MNMGQIRVIHEHYDYKPWASIIAGLLIAILAIFRLVVDKDKSLANLVLFTLVVLPPLVILLIDIFKRNKPTFVVYNDRIEVRKGRKSQRTEIMYSDIRNLAYESGVLTVWFDEYSAPSCYYLGAKLKDDQETYDILRAAYDQYNQEHNFKSVPVENLPQKKNGMKKVVMIVTMLCVLALLIFLRHL